MIRKQNMRSFSLITKKEINNKTHSLTNENCTFTRLTTTTEAVLSVRALKREEKKL